MQTIITKYLCPTNVRGARIKATAQAGSITLSWDYALDAEGNHKAACTALVAKLDWTHPNYGKTICGQNPDGSYTHVFTLRARKSSSVDAVYHARELEKVDGIISAKFFGDSGETRQMNITSKQFAAIVDILTCEEFDA